MTDKVVEWDIDANLPMYTRDYLKMKTEEVKNRPRVILAGTTEAAVNFCREHNLHPTDVTIVRGITSIEGLRFRYEDVFRVPGWSKRTDIEEIEDRILSTHIIMCPR